MNNNLHSPAIEDEIKTLLASPKPGEEFVTRLSDQLKRQAAQQEKRVVKPLIYRPVFIAFTVMVLSLLVSLLYFSPEAVYAAVRRLFGYLPGVGIVDENAPLRILKQPVSDTRDGVTISVNSAILTSKETQLNFDVIGVPPSAYADKEHASSCPIPEEYLILPDGTRLDSYSPIPTDVDHATFVIPCIFNTLPDVVPTDWEIPLEFIAIPPEATILPVVEQQPTVKTTTQASSSEISRSAPYTLLVDQFIKTDNGYILIGSFHAAINLDGWMQTTGPIQVEDANGQTVPYSVPDDIQISGDSIKQSPWVLEFNSTDVTFPITIHMPGNVYTSVDPNLTASIEFNAGADPQFGQEWDVKQDIVLGKYHILLDSIRASENGYTFKFKYQNDAGGNITMPRVQIEGFESVGGGGGGGPDGGETNLDFKEIPTGKLHVIFSDIYTVIDNQTWQVQWQPDSVETN